MSNQNKDNQNKLSHSKVGRPSKITEEVVAKLESIFKLDVPIETACKYAEIHKTTFYRNYEQNKDFATKIDKAREFARIAASRVVSKAIVEDEDVSTARWYLEKRFPNEYSSGNANIAIQGDKILVIPGELLEKHGITPDTEASSKEQ